MTPPAYQLYKKGSLTLTFILLAGLAGQIFTFFLVSVLGWSDRLGAWIMLLSLLPLAVAIFFMFRLMSRVSRERLGGLGDYFRANGFRFVKEPGADDRAQFSAPLDGSMATLGLETGANGIQWFAVQNGEAPTLRIFEHRFVRGTGKGALEHFNTVVIWPTGHRDLRLAAGVRTPPTTARETWFSGSGAVCVRIGGCVDADNLGRLLAYARSVLGAGETRG